MDTQAFEHWLAQASQLSHTQRSTALRVLHEHAVMAAGQKRLPDLSACPHCQAPPAQLAPWGWSRGLRRYRCRACRRTCCTLTGTALHTTRKAALSAHLRINRITWIASNVRNICFVRIAQIWPGCLN